MAPSVYNENYKSAILLTEWKQAQDITYFVTALITDVKVFIALAPGVNHLKTYMHVNVGLLR